MIRGTWDVGRALQPPLVTVHCRTPGLGSPWGVSTGTVTTLTSQWSQGPAGQPKKHSPRYRQMHVAAESTKVLSHPTVVTRRPVLSDCSFRCGGNS